MVIMRCGSPVPFSTQRSLGGASVRGSARVFRSVGTPYMDKDVMKIMNLYKELEKAGSLKAGPVDLQYREYVKQRTKGSNSAASRAI